LDFEVYSVTQLERILYRRAVNGLYDTEPVVNDEGVIVGVDSSVITDEVITLCAENAHRERGSARQAIDLLGQAATFAHDDRDDEISTNHVDTALEEVNKNYIKKMLGDCSADDLLTLCGVLYLYSRNETPARTDEIHKYYSKYAEAIGKEPLVQRRMRDRLQYLELNGILSMQKQTGGRMGGPRWESDLAIPFAETVDILGSDQEYEREYSAIAEEIGAGGKVDE